MVDLKQNKVIKWSTAFWYSIHSISSKSVTFDCSIDLSVMFRSVIAASGMDSQASRNLHNLISINQFVIATGAFLKSHKSAFITLKFRASFSTLTSTVAIFWFVQMPWVFTWPAWLLLLVVLETSAQFIYFALDISVSVYLAAQ